MSEQTARPAVRPVMLIILDGWGIREMDAGNAPLIANTPNYTRWLASQERAIVDASEEAVGLTPGQMGNSEVGHLNLGAGRVVYQDITRMELAIKDGSFATHEGLLEAFHVAKQRGTNVHLVGLLSDGGVHSHQRHLNALLDVTQLHGVNPVIHIITDGRDTPQESGMGFVTLLEERIQSKGHGRISTISGRYYAMDRDKRAERTKLAYDTMVFRESESRAPTASLALKASYEAGVTDEFVVPTVIGTDESLAFQTGDVVICYNFRADRMRQTVEALTGLTPDYSGSRLIPELHIVTFTVYEDNYPVSVLFGKEKLKNVLAEVVSSAGMTQYHSAETEKYPHVTFFFNGRIQEEFPGETRCIIPSPKVATYDLKPEMSAAELTEATLERLQTHNDDFLLVNFANPDMVGHTGILSAAIKACEFVDSYAGKLVDAITAKGGVAIVTADHGNCERMVELATGEPHTYHTTNPVGLFVIGNGYYRLRPRGKLADVAPTVIDLLGLTQPAEMTGLSLLEAWREAGPADHTTIK